MSLVQLLTIIREDLKNCCGSSVLLRIIGFFLNPSFRLILNYRIGSFLAARRNWLVNLIIMHYKHRQITHRNCDISYHSTIGRNIRFPHPLGIVIGEGVVVKDSVSIWQHVTLGSHGKPGKKKLDYPIIENDVKIFTGATIIGSVSVGAGAIIGAHAVVSKDVNAGAIVVGIPGKEKIKNKNYDA